MSSHLNQIQTLIAEIDGVLQQPSPRLPWMGETLKDSRRVLERTRSYLIELEQSFTLGDVVDCRSSTSLITASPASATIAGQYNPNEAANAQQVLQTVMGELLNLRTNLTDRWQNDLEALQRERDELVKEIRQLEVQRQHQQSLAQQSAQQQKVIAEFMQVLISRLQETLTDQLAQTLNHIEQQFLGYETEASGETTPLLPTEAGADAAYLPMWEPSALYGQRPSVPTHPRQRIAQLKALQQKTDELIIGFDSTLTVVFEALLRNVQGYEESLAKGVEKMHSMGQQGEIVFTHLINHLAQKIGQEAAVLLQTSAAPSLEPASRAPEPQPTTKEPSPKEAKKTPKTDSLATTTAPEKPPTTGTPAPTPTPEPAPDPKSLELEEQLMSFQVETPETPSSEASQVTPSLEEADLDKWMLALSAEWQPEASPEQTPSSPPETVPGPIEDLYAQLFGLEEAPAAETPAGTPAPEATIPSFEEALFADIPDNISEVDMAANPAWAAEITPEITASPEAQTLEEFLFLDGDPSQNTNKLSDSDRRFDNVVTRTSNPQTEPATEPKASEEDLFGSDFSTSNRSAETLNQSDTSDIFDQLFPTSSPPVPTAEPDPLTLTEDWAAEKYIPASPEEDLLPTEEEEESDTYRLALDTTTLQQLSSDLSKLEVVETNRKQTASEPLGLTSEDTLTIEEWAAQGLEPAPATSPAPVTGNPTQADWEQDLELSGELDTPNRPTENPPTINGDATIEEEPLLNGMEDWLAQITSAQTLETVPPAFWNVPEPPPVAKEPQNMTLDEAFASLGNQERWQETSHKPAQNPETDLVAPLGPPQILADLETSTLDDLFATLTAENLTSPSPSSGDLFGPVPVKPPTPTPPPSLENVESNTLDDLFATLIADPTPGGEQDQELFGSRSGGDDDLDLFSFNWEDSQIGNSDESSSEKKKDLGKVEAVSEAPPPPTVSILAPPEPGVWYLGLDFGSTGLSATLLNRQTGLVHPLYWCSSDALEPAGSQNRCFRLPSLAYLSLTEADPVPGELSVEPACFSLSASQVVVGEAAKAMAESGSPNGLLLRQFKPYLKVGVAGADIKDAANALSVGVESMLSWSDRQLLPMRWLIQSLQALLKTTKPQKENQIIGGALGLEKYNFAEAMQSLAGVMLSFPGGWPDSYSFNLREAVLAAGLVSRADQVLLVEEAIATLLSLLPGRCAVASAGVSGSEKLPVFNADWLGFSLVVSAGAAMTELALVRLPDRLADLSRPDIHLASFAYAGEAMDLDIICQLLLKDSANRLTQELQLPPTQEWPTPGEPDLQKRYRLRRCLQSTPLGEWLLDAANQLKVILQHQNRFVLQRGAAEWVCSRRELEARVFVPFVQRLNRELNGLLAQTGVPVVGVNQVICSGGAASLPAIARWLRQKFPNATIIQDTYSPDRPLACSRVALGLASLPYSLPVVDIYRHQYSDLFLLQELLLAVPNHPCSLAEILAVLSKRGINSRAVQDRLVAFLDGYLPVGIRPETGDLELLSEESRHDPDYLGLHAALLFYKQEDGTYRPNVEQCQRLRHYLNQLLSGTYQKLQEPLMLTSFAVV